MSDLERLKLINLKAKVTRELETHLGVSDEVLVNFLISESRKCSTEDDFFGKMNSVDESFSLELATSIFFLVTRLLDQNEEKEQGEATLEGDQNLEAIKEETGEGQVEIEKEANSGLGIIQEDPALPEGKDAPQNKRKMFPGLSLQNSKAKKEDVRNEEALDLENSCETKSGSDSEKSRKRKRSKKKIKKKKSKKIKSKSKHKKSKKSDRKESKRERRERKSKRKRKYLEDQDLKVGNTFRGRVKRILSFGAVIGFMTSRGRREGLVHISNLKNFRVRNVTDIIEDGETVYVKVLEIDGRKVSLSMKELDQRTGEDVVRGVDTRRSRRMQQFFTEKAVEVGGNRVGGNMGVITGVRLDLDRKVKKRLDKNEGNQLDAWERTR